MKTNYSCHTALTEYADAITWLSFVDCLGLLMWPDSDLTGQRHGQGNVEPDEQEASCSVYGRRALL